MILNILKIKNYQEIEREKRRKNKLNDDMKLLVNKIKTEKKKKYKNSIS